jgi:hypothetical protein
MDIIHRFDNLLGSLGYQKGFSIKFDINVYTNKDNFTICYKNEELEWYITIEHSNSDSYYSKIRFEFFKISSDYLSPNNVDDTYFNKFLYYRKGDNFNMEVENIKSEEFFSMCKSIIKEKLPNSFRKLKIKQLLEE